MQLKLRKGEDKRLRVGHLWIFSNEVDTKETPISDIEPGSVVRVVDFRGKPLGTALANPGTLICARMMSRKPNAEINAQFMQNRLAQALRIRELAFETPHYRMVNGEGDFLPGLIVDRFGDVLSVQANTAGMDVLTPMILDALDALIAPRAIILRNDSQARELEGLPREIVAAKGDIPETVEVIEGGLKFRAPLAGGQKTGFYFDMRAVRMRAGDLAAATGGSMIDCFSYVGAMGVRAAVKGASEVLCIDASQTALDFVEENARLNGVADKVHTERGDAFEVLEAQPKNSFDFVSADPPAFIKRKKDMKKGERAYGRLQKITAGLVKDGGFLLGASCSQHFDAPSLKRAIAEGIRSSGAMGRMLWQGAQDMDHPANSAMRETEYLKAFCFALNK